MFVVEEEMGTLALDEERVEWREYVDQFRGGIAGLDHSGTSPVVLLARALKADRHKLLAANPVFDQLPDRRLAFGIEMADRIQAHNSLRAQGAIQQVARRFLRRG